ncbi:AMP-binding protein [Microbacterium sp.]|uniref:AMP-binding protein n=1 Tax=Microbacterium sp. TaxID=51671 RepID=UPI0037C7562D
MDTPAPSPAGSAASVPIGDILVRRARESGRQSSIHWRAHGDDHALSYGSLAAASTRTAQAFAGTLSAGDRVAVWARNTLEWVVIEYACALSGMVLAPFDIGWTDDEVARAVRLTAPTLLFCGRDASGERLDARAQLLGGGTQVIDIRTLPGWVSEQRPAPLPDVSVADPFLGRVAFGGDGSADVVTMDHASALERAYRTHPRESSEAGAAVEVGPFHDVHVNCAIVLGSLVTGGAFVLSA